MYYDARICGGITLVALVAAAWFSARLAQADAAFRERSLESVEHAARIMPRNTDYLSLHALQIEYEAQNSTEVLTRIAALNPLASAPRIRLGLAAELGGDFASAEKWLLDAARVDRQFEPGWTLANFYFRRRDADQFWKWIRSALEVSYGDRAPAFDLCWRMSSDPREIFARAIPRYGEVLGAYGWYLLTARPAALGPVALTLAEEHDPADRALLLKLSDALIDAHQTADASALWKALGNPDDPGHGFNWRPVETPGVIHSESGAHRIVFDGRESEQTDLAVQFVVTHPGARYVVHWEARTQGLHQATGIEWHAEGGQASVRASDAWLPGEMEFTAATELSKLTLVYRRPSGEARAEGTLELRAITIAEASR